MDANIPFACDICGKSFKHKSSMTAHKMIHIGVKPFQCDICEKSFTHRSTLARHKRIHTGEKPYECDVCNKTFSRSGGLTNHKIIHTGVKPYECDVCQKTFSLSNTLAQHKRIHTGEKRYECDICEKTFSHSSNLTQHKKIHTGEKPYSCEICQKSFNSNHHLSRHNQTAAHLERKELQNTDLTSAQTSFLDCGESIKVKDIKEEIYECRICEKSCSTKGNLAVHKRIHSDEKRYSCDICQKSFNSSSHLSRHNKTISHLERKELQNTDLTSAQTSFVDCGESIKVKDIKEEINEEESVDDPFFFQGEKTKGDIYNKCSESMKLEEIKEETKNKENVDDPLLINYFTKSDVKQEIKEGVKDLDEGQGAEVSNLDTEHNDGCRR